jgi:ADP-ribose pyrophosphatase YjhB (NUDIX family)
MRVTALALIRRGDDLLVERGYDRVSGETFYRLLGGGIEEGELGADTVRRELREELGIEVEVGRRLATIENIFTWEGKGWHEIALVYECSLGDAVLPEGEWEVPDGDVVHEVCWKRMCDLAAGSERLYPEELESLLAGTP